MKKIIVLIACVLFSMMANAREQGIVDKLNDEKGKIEHCYANLADDTLFIGNSFIERRFMWNEGSLVSIGITNKRTGKVMQLCNVEHPDFSIPGLQPLPNKNKLSVKVVQATPIVPSYLGAEISTTYSGLEVKQVFRIFPSSMGIACEYHLKKTSDEISIAPDGIFMENLFFPSIHWEVEAVEFFDNTDHNDNLVRKSKIIPFRTNEYVGNILYLGNPTENGGIFILKEAPCSSVQNNYPGYDFTSEVNRQNSQQTLSIRSVGLGITDKDLPEGEWVKTYSYVLGVHDNTETGKRIALRSYQDNTRILDPQRDEMIMVNTWGDRNRDASLSEAFILKELHQAHKLGFSHYMIDDGWQEGLSTNSAQKGDRKWNEWSVADWQPNKKRFPNGFDNIIKLADSLDIEMGLWFHPSNEAEYATWKQDADILINLYRQFGIRYIKIDGVKLPSKRSDINLRKFFDRVLTETGYQIVFSLDATANNRYGYHCNNDLGNVFLENRYTDWQNYYPYKTLRNIWMLSAYVPSQKIQLEFLNKWRNQDIYGADPYAPSGYSFDYLFAITMPGQPLAWFETTGLPEEAESSIDLFKTFKTTSADLHAARIFPIGNEPNGTTFTGFQFISTGTEGFILVFRELNDLDECNIQTMFTPGSVISLEKIAGRGPDFRAETDGNGRIRVHLNEANSFALYRYHVVGEK